MVLIVKILDLWNPQYEMMLSIIEIIYIYIHVDICVYYMNSHNVIIETYINQY